MSKRPPQHPMQPIVWDEHGVIRFKPNAIIAHLQETGIISLNTIAAMGFPREDREQLAQLIGYSVSGFGDLSYARKATVARADAIADKMARKRKRKAKPPTEGT